MNPIPFVDRSPTFHEIERFRLLLSTFQDGSGMLAVEKYKGRKWVTHNHARSLPGWRDFERSVALAFDGTATENKWIYDVILTDSMNHYGVSCKMRGELHKAMKVPGRASIELSNAAGEFWQAIKTSSGLNEETYRTEPNRVGEILIRTVEGWHHAANVRDVRKVDTAQSFFLNLLWDERSGQYQLFQFPTQLPNHSSIDWTVQGRRLVGKDEQGTLFEWYGHSGGQLKYYPLIDHATWKSEIFSLEPIPQDLKEVALNKAALYFPTIWERIND